MRVIFGEHVGSGVDRARRIPLGYSVSHFLANMQVANFYGNSIMTISKDEGADLED